MSIQIMTDRRAKMLSSRSFLCCTIMVWFLAYAVHGWTCLKGRTATAAKTKKRPRDRTITSTSLWARPWADDPASGSFEKENQKNSQQQADRPTQTRNDPLGPELVIPSKAKIVVLGATGKIGRLVVQRLLQTSSLGDATIVAVVRDYDKACRVLYDDLVVANRSRKRGRKQPQLQIVQADLVPAEELPGFDEDDEDPEEEEDQEWLARATSAASFYGDTVDEYDDGKLEGTTPCNEALQEAIRDSTTIISCVGTVRPSNLWTDFLARPLLRILKRDVRDWCGDPRHPYYVNFASTRKALGYAEKEQTRREAIICMDDSSNEKENSPFNKITDPKPIIPRILFIRISDLCVAQRPWHFVPLLTNIMHSMVFRYQDMTEQLLEASTSIDTVVVRPGDLCDEERNVTSTSLQVHPSGSVPSPSRVGREDVAALVVACTLMSNHYVSRNKLRSIPAINTEIGGKRDDDEKVTTLREQQRPPFHYTLGVRWVGAGLDPYPAQGKMSDGFKNAKAALQSAIKIIRKQEKRDEKMERTRRIRSGRQGEGVSDRSLQTRRRRRRLKPYGICVAVPVYLTLFLLVGATISAVFPYVPESGKQLILPMARWLKQAVAMASVVLGRLVTVLRQRLPQLLTGKTAQQYISF